MMCEIGNDQRYRRAAQHDGVHRAGQAGTIHGSTVTSHSQPDPRLSGNVWGFSRASTGADALGIPDPFRLDGLGEAAPDCLRGCGHKASTSGECILVACHALRMESTSLLADRPGASLSETACAHLAWCRYEVLARHRFGTPILDRSARVGASEDQYHGR